MLFRGAETHTRSVLKAISWRTLGTLDTFAISWFLTGQDEQILRVAVHAHGDPVQPGQAGQALRVLLAVLKALDQAELAFHQRLAATGQVDEHGVGLAARGAVFSSGAGRGRRHVPARFVEDVRCLIGPLEGVRLGRTSPEPRHRGRNRLLPRELVGRPDRGLVRHPHYVHRNEHGDREDQGEEENSG